MRVKGLANKDGAVSRARSLRRGQTPAERTLWAHVANRRLAGAKFRRQQPIGPYIVDFVSFAYRLVIELDGGQHNAAPTRAKDVLRTTWLEDQGFTVLRFWNSDVLGNPEGVLHRISIELESPGETPSS